MSPIHPVGLFSFATYKRLPVEALANGYLTIHLALIVIRSEKGRKAGFIGSIFR